jgi:flagella basal body P-ring formation protein FlgA
MRRALFLAAAIALLPHPAAAQTLSPAQVRQALGIGTSPSQPAPYTPALSQQQMLVAVLAHAVQRGDRLTAGDFVEDQMPAYRGRDALSPRNLEGMEAVRNLPAGTPLRATDVMTPRLVRRGEPVTIRYVAGPLTISGSGRALGDGGQGDLVRVVTESSRTIDALVDGQGAVRITN